MIRCLECQPPLDLPDLAMATRHFQLQHCDLLAGLNQWEQADAISKGLRRALQGGS